MRCQRASATSGILTAGGQADMHDNPGCGGGDKIEGSAMRGQNMAGNIQPDRGAGGDIAGMLAIGARHAAER